IGTPQAGEHAPAIDEGRFSGLTSLRDDVFTRAGAFSDTPDAGEILPEPAATDVGRFKTPGLRNIARTAPYMHDGVYATLWDVVNHYNFGGGTGRYSGGKDVAMIPLLLGNEEMNDLV